MMSWVLGAKKGGRGLRGDVVSGLADGGWMDGEGMRSLMVDAWWREC